MTPLEPDVVERVALKPCPFCGGTADTIVNDRGYWQAECQSCRASGDGALAECDAIREWNTRAAISAQSPQLEDLREALVRADRAFDLIDLALPVLINMLGTVGLGAGKGRAEDVRGAVADARHHIRAALNSGIGGGS